MLLAYTHMHVHAYRNAVRPVHTDKAVIDVLAVYGHSVCSDWSVPFLCQLLNILNIIPVYMHWKMFLKMLRSFLGGF